jgi:hypothetical protein
MLKEFFMKKMLDKQLAGMPAADREKVMSAIEKNPELFTKVGAALQEKMKQGKSQMTAAMEVANEFKDELSKIITK